ncbi:hypothetical protein MPH_00986 [Macrophomina phaseolina MS6]|uniref:Uncharacterized protein n=1 Tax=Macrophomina phaseolina (strain MS6) TaxID=1126212 RepID=K2RGK7_MACPH|nr:hypothetical protein MPH_00986 [Macrophomina phaseolina MS6]
MGGKQTYTALRASSSDENILPYTHSDEASSQCPNLHSEKLSRKPLRILYAFVVLFTTTAILPLFFASTLLFLRDNTENSVSYAPREIHLSDEINGLIPSFTNRQVTFTNISQYWPSSAPLEEVSEEEWSSVFQMWHHLAPREYLRTHSGRCYSADPHAIEKTVVGFSE